MKNGTTKKRAVHAPATGPDGGVTVCGLSYGMNGIEVTPIMQAVTCQRCKPPRKAPVVEGIGAPPLAFPEEEIRAISEALGGRSSFIATRRQRSWQAALRRVEAWEARHGRS